MYFQIVLLIDAVVLIIVGNGATVHHVNHCYTCATHLLGAHCTKQRTCPPNNVCYIQKLTDEQGNHERYAGGCTDYHLCADIAKQHNHRIKVAEATCCYTPNCNDPAIFTRATTTTYAPRLVNQCHTCSLRDGRWDCRSVMVCGGGEVCYGQKLMLQILNKDIYFHAGCIKQSKCATVSKQSVLGDYGMTHVLEGACCSKDNCNGDIMKNFIGTQCHECQGDDCLVQHIKISSCPKSSPLCMTTIDNKPTGEKSYSKSCASASQCNSQWLQQSALKPECVGFHPSLSYNFSFSCTYCCKDDVCNEMDVPPVASMYLG